MPNESFDEYLPSLINDEYYIPPNTDIFILRGVPLDNTYEHTIAWENLDASRTKQTNYFLSKVKYGLPKQYYQRINREWMKINIEADQLYDCNYLMFRNTAFNSEKWWYAFILDVEYINNNTSKVRYEIDVMQSWQPGPHMDYQPLQCFVERCHAISDELYENLVPESIVNTNEYMVDYKQTFNMNKQSVIVLTSEMYIGENPGIIPGYQFSPANGYLQYYSYGKVDVMKFDVINDDMSVNTSELQRLNEFLNPYVNAGKEDSVIAIYMCPTNIFNYTSVNVPKEYSINLPIQNPGNALGGATYVPKNNKLYSYPFSQIKINNQCGITKVYKWELFNRASRGKFTITGVHTWMPCAVIYPNEYRKISKNLEDSVTFDKFTICPWGSDAFRAWWAQNASQINASVAGGIASVIAAVAGAASANPMLIATGVGGVISAGTKIGTSLMEATHRPTSTHGNSDTSLILTALQETQFVITKESLLPEMLQIYDDYFTKYGYAQKKIMVPPMVNRERWTYVQTVGFEFSGEINDMDTKKIKSIYDNGVTFWRNPDDIGHYDFSNNPLV